MTAAQRILSQKNVEQKKKLADVRVFSEHFECLVGRERTDRQAVGFDLSLFEGSITYFILEQKRTLRKTSVLPAQRKR